MRPSQLPDLISACLSARKNVVVEGPPGIGKTVSVQMFAEELAGREKLPLLYAYQVESLEKFRREQCPGGRCVLLIYINVNASLPVDLSGIPDKVSADGETYVRFLPLVWWHACRYARYCIVFLDEYNTTESPDMRAAVMRMLGECMAGVVHLGCGEKRDGFTLVVAAGNPSDSNAVASEPPAPLLGGKVCRFRVEPPTLSEWIRYMHRRHGNRWNSEVAGFLAENPALFARLPPGPTATEPYPTPRGWEAVALVPREKLSREIVASLVGADAADAFVAYLKTTPPSLEDIAETEQRELLYVRLLSYSARGRLCRSLESRKETEVLGRLLREKLSGDEIAVISYVASPWCPEKMWKFWMLVPKEKKEGALADRYVLAEATSAAREPEDVVEELL